MSSKPRRVHHMYNTIEIHEDGAVASILLNRPEARNAFSMELVRELEAAARHFDTRSHIKVVSISAAGRSFCAGADLVEFSQADDDSSKRQVVDAGRRMIQVVAGMRAITVAQVRGHCIGGGLVLMMACDFRYAAKDAQFRLPEAELGLPFAWGGTAWLTREIGALLTAELILTGRELSGDDAQACGLVNKAVPAATLADMVAQQIQTLASRSALILETTKAQIAAAKQALCVDGHAYSDSHALHSALTDPESMLIRDRYFSRSTMKPAGAIANPDP